MHIPEIRDGAFGGNLSRAANSGFAGNRPGNVGVVEERGDMPTDRITPETLKGWPKGNPLLARLS